MTDLKKEDFEKSCRGVWFTSKVSRKGVTKGNKYFGELTENGWVEFFNDDLILDTSLLEECLKLPPKEKEELELALEILEKVNGKDRLQGMGETPAANDSVYEDLSNTSNEDFLQEVEEVHEEFRSQFDRQVGGSHYQLAIQPILYIIANKLPFCEGNVVKYISRYKEKKGAEDLKKVIHYTQMLLEAEYGVFSDIVYSDEEIFEEDDEEETSEEE